MVALNGNNQTLLVTGFWIFKRYYLYVPGDGVYRLETFSVKQQLEAARRKAQNATTTTSAT